MYSLMLNDGSAAEVSMAGVGQQGGLWIHVHNSSMGECFRIFSDPQKTAAMSIEYDPTIGDEFTGYTELISLSVCDGFIKVGLERSSNA